MAAMATNLQSTSLATQKHHFKKRTGTTRERTGCSTCRQRRKKCVDNTYPICGHCRRLNLECVRESPRSLIASTSTRQTLILESFDVSKIIPPHSVASARDAVITIPNTMMLGACKDMEASLERRYLLKYYTQVLCTMVTTNHKNNCFLSVFLPMATESPPLLSTIIAWSAAHLSCFQPTYRIDALEKQSLALCSVSAALSAPLLPSTQEANLAACLCLCSIEVAIGDTSRWYQHLIGAKQIIMSVSQDGPGGRMLYGPEVLMQTLDGEWLLRNFAYHDVLGSVLLDKPPLIQGCYWLREGAEIVDTHMGIASRILALISEIMSIALPTAPSAASSLASSQSSSAQTPPQDGTDLWLAFVSLEYRLQSWTPPPASQTGLISLAEAYRAAALLLLYRRMRQASRVHYKFPNVQDKIAVQVRRVLWHLGDIPPTSLEECGSLFPLFLAGGDTRVQEEIEAVQLQMADLLAFRGFENVRRASEILRELWRLRMCGMRGRDGEEVDWKDVVERTGEKLMLA